MKIKHSKQWYFWVSKLVWAVGAILCFVPTAIVGYLKLPAIVTTRADTTLTGAAILVLACCAYPMLKIVFHLLKSPSAWFILSVVALLTTAIYFIPKTTVYALVVVFWVAACGNIVGAILFKVAAVLKERWKYCGQIELMGGKV